MNHLTQLLQKEVQHFQRLGDQAQRFMISLFLYTLISPIFGIFINAFLWRQSQDLVQVALYNLVSFIAVPFGFYLNGIMLKRYPSTQLYFFGLLTGAITAATLIFLSNITLLTILIFGFINGITIGLYWANRNLLTLRTTHSDNRIYFSGIETISQTTSGIIIPIIVGFFITSGTTLALYTPLVAYKILAVMLLVMSVIIGLHILGMAPTKERISSLWVTSANKRWQKFRWYEICVGFLTGTTAFLPALMVFVLVGKEDALGTIQSLSAIISAFVVYQLAKKLTIKHRLHLVTYSIVISFIGAGLFSLFFSSFGVIIFFATAAIAGPFLLVSLNSLNYDLIDEDSQSANHYAYVCDQEIYLNLGRVIAIAFFIVLIYLFSKDFALRFTPLAYAAFQIFLYLIARSLEKKP